ncbi:MAG: TonB-dependent receptor [Bacteroidales bacterium]|jgi:TonB-linked SusC/RagA family outer membrane protein|nr:TonB-dependent receptor [Bacteroidales bacterium]
MHQQKIKWNAWRKLLLSLCMCICALSLSAQQGIRVGGTVSDKDGETIPGVNVVVRGSTIGTVTDINGEFTITVPSDTSVLQFSFVGYRTQDVIVGKRKIIPVALSEEAAEIGEVTIVAFGTQKKESVIASITTINPADLKVPSSNLTTAFAGQMAGVIAYQRSGEPGADNADFFVRGITTFGSNTRPLILIDGIELTSTDLARLPPDDIASFSIMKDATATALYGARGANGVILVTTRQGKEGPAKISFRVENSWSMPTRNIELADPITYMRLENEAVLTRNPITGVPVYSDEKIADTESGRDPIRFPANDWLDMLFKKYTINQRYNLSVSGGGGVARYYVAGSFSQDNGMLKIDKRQNFNNNIDNKSYILRSNVNIDITKTTEMIVRLSGAFDDYSGPIAGGTDMYGIIMRSNPVMFPAYYPVTPETSYISHIMFGNVEDWSRYINPYAESLRGYKDKNRSQILAQLEAKQDLKFLTEGLSARGLLNISRLSQFSVRRYYNPNYYTMERYNYATKAYTLRRVNDGTDYLGYDEPGGDKETSATFYFEGMINYNRTFAEKHAVSGLLVYIARESLRANTGSLQLSLPSRNLGLSGRLTYAYDNRYFGEFNFGYNGSERFAQSHRYGFFPSFGLAWNISKEQFWESLKPVVSNLKLRYSYGLVGNDQIGSASDRFFYLSEMIMNDGGRGMTFGANLDRGYAGISVDRYANEDITWETSAKQNYAIEIGLWEKISVIAEYFTEHRYNILMTRSSIPLTMGIVNRSKVRANVGEATGSGVDLSMEYQQNWSSHFWTAARGNYTFARSKYKVYEEPAYDEPWRYRAGHLVTQAWGYIGERLFVDDAEAENSPRQEISSYKYGGGDIKYTDVSGDGRITDKDAVPIGNPTVPEIVYGFGFSMGYKGFDASIFFQGLTNESFWINSNAVSPFVDQHNLLKVIADDHWSEESRNLYAFWPRLNPDYNGNNNITNTWWMRNGSFLRLKQAEIGYSIEGKWKEKFRINAMRFYISGTNLLLLSKFKLWDVEMAGNGLGYPIQKVFNIGLNVTFN